MEAIAKIFYGVPIKRMTAAQTTDLEIAGLSTGHFGETREEGFYVAIRASEQRSAIGFALPLRPLVIDDAWSTQLSAALARHELEAAGPAAWYLVSYLDA